MPLESIDWVRFFFDQRTKSIRYFFTEHPTKFIASDGSLIDFGFRLTRQSGGCAVHGVTATNNMGV